MGSEKSCSLVCALCCFLLVPFVLQSVGFFTPMWASNSTCDSIGLHYSCCFGAGHTKCKDTYGVNELDVRALALEATSFSIMFLVVFLPCCGAFDDSYAALGTFCILLLPVAGLFSLTGCIIVATKFSTSELGYSFALCLTAGVLIIILTVVLCIDICILPKDDTSTNKARRIGRFSVSPTPAAEPYQNGGAAAPFEPGTQWIDYELQDTSHYQAVAIHDKEPGDSWFL